MVGLFSKLFEGKKSEDVKNIDNNFYDIINDLNNNEKTKKIAKQLQFLKNDENSTKEDYTLILNNLNEIVNFEKEKAIFKNKILELKEELYIVKKGIFLNEVKDFENFYSDFEILENDINFLEKLSEILKTIFEKDALNQIFLDYKVLYSSYLKIKEDSDNLLLEETEFTKEVEKFSSAISELERKYRISADWDGKKPAMISYRKKLIEKRETFLKKEEELNKKIEVIYLTYKVLKDKFLKENDYIEDFLKKEEMFFKGDSNELELMNKVYLNLKEGIDNIQ